MYRVSCVGCEGKRATLSACVEGYFAGVIARHARGITRERENIGARDGGREERGFNKSKLSSRFERG